MRGDVPRCKPLRTGWRSVFPACAGMFLDPESFAEPDYGFPRVRGDVPSLPETHATFYRFSPRARGCSPSSRNLKTSYNRFPRVRGDVPWFSYGAARDFSFSPRARGCSLCVIALMKQSLVFPACAGMFRRTRNWYFARRSFPRVRGDVPTHHFYHRKQDRFSPRARGCSSKPIFWISAKTVFPACAGMFLAPSAARWTAQSFPRVRGDVPCSLVVYRTCNSFSPRARGCSHKSKPHHFNVNVFPACAGMFLSVKLAFAMPRSFPRVRGDVPHLIGVRVDTDLFSPRARGCSAPIFPARSRWRSFPRVRGDVPTGQKARLACVEFSPRARGCSFTLDRVAQILIVFPACAGMFPLH